MPLRKRESLAPYGDTLPHFRERLHYTPKYADQERVAALLWEEWNTIDPGLNYGFTAIEFILYGDSKSRFPISERDRQVIAATVQHIMGTNDGRAFQDRFQQELEKAQSVEQGKEKTHNHSRIIHGRSFRFDRYPDGCLVHID